MERILMVLGQVQGIVSRSDDDYVDKLNRRYTTFLLCVFAIVVSAKQYVGDPITCWCPAEFKDNYEDFTNKYCWVYNTYHVPITQQQIPGAGEPKAYIGYYQWVPIILLVQALLFYIPCLFWRSLNSKTGIDVDNVIKSAKEVQRTAYLEQKDKMIGFISRSMDRYLRMTRRYKDEENCMKVCKYHFSMNFCLVCGSRRFGNYLVVLYLITKALYAANAVGQLFLLNSFLGTKGRMYGYEIMNSLLKGEDWAVSYTFPRVTLCDFAIRDLNNIRHYTVQCVLPLTFFNEKIYIIVWFWFVIVAVANLSNLCMWIIRIFIHKERARYVKHHISFLERTPKSFKSEPMDKTRLRRFVAVYLKKDGILILRLLEQNTNGLIVSEIVSDLYSYYKYSKIDRGYTDDSAREIFEDI